MTSHRGAADPFGVVALAGAGTIGAHELGYLVAPASSVGHGHLAVLGPLALFGLCVAGWMAAIRLLRAGGAGRSGGVSWQRLAALQTAMYLALEIGERLATGELASLASAPVALGLLLQPVFAWAAVRLIELGGSVLLAVFGRSHARRAAQPLRSQSAPVAVFVDAFVGVRVRLRGPPGC